MAVKTVVGGTIVLEGFAQLEKALREAAPLVKRDLNKALKKAVEKIRVAAAEGVPNKTGRGTGVLAASIKTTAGTQNVSVWSNTPWAFVQDQGGRVGRDHATLLPRAGASHYMTKAVTKEVDGALEGDITKAMDEALKALN